MNINDLLKMDMGQAAEWLIENQHDFEVVPKKPTQQMLYGADSTDLNEFCTSSRQSRQHEIAGQIYVEMVDRVTLTNMNEEPEKPLLICKPCKISEGYEFTATGCHTVRKITCDKCGQAGTHWPNRHFRKISKSA